MPDVSILSPSVATSPKQYTVTGTQDIVLRTVAATYDGTGAAGSFVPALQIVDNTGVVVATFPITNTLAAGASADVTWFPSVGGSPASTSSVGTWNYATPVAPASAPPGAVAGAAFANGWLNTVLSDGTYSPLMYRTENGGATVRVVGAIGGGTYGAPAVVLPTGFTPLNDILQICPGLDNVSSLQATLNTAGLLTPVGPSGSGLTLLYSQVLSSGSTTLDTGTGGISQAFTHLWIRASIITSQAAAGSGATMTVNNDTGANYDYQRAAAEGASGVFSATNAANGWALNIHGNSSSTLYASAVDYWIENYTGITFWKTGHGFDGIIDSNAANINLVRRHIGWRNTAAINRVTITAGSGTFETGSGLWVYGS